MYPSINLTVISTVLLKLTFVQTDSNKPIFCGNNQRATGKYLSAETGGSLDILNRARCKLDLTRLCQQTPLSLGHSQSS